MENINIEEDSDSEENKPIKKEKKKTGIKANSESDEEMITQPQKGGFALLMDDAGDSLPSEDSAEEEAVVAPKKSKDRKAKKPAYNMLDQDGSEESDDGDKPSKEKKKKKKGKDEDKEEFKDDPPKGEKGGKKKKKKKGKKDDDDDEDLDAMLAALRSEYSGEPVPEGTATEEQVDGKKEKKKKGKKDETKDGAGDLGFEVIDDEEVGGTVKTAAQKKKEKKERQMQKAREEREASKGKDVSVEKEVLKKQESVEKEDTPVPDEPVPDGEENEDGEMEGKKDKEEDDKKKKKPNKAVLAAMQEALAKQKEEEERLQKEEEEKERLAEEAFQAKIEAKKKEEEKKAAKKEREKLKKAELKAAGKLLTPAQKQAKLRAEAMLEAMRAQGVDVPAVGEKRPRPGTRKRMNQKNKQTGKEASPEDDSLKEATPEEETKVEDKVEEETKEEVVAESWDAVEDVKDAWDADSDKEVEADVKNPPIEEKIEEPEVSEDDESDEDGSDEESEEESSSEEEEEEEEEDKTLAEKKRERAIARIKKRMADNEAARSVDKLRAPVVCVLGHVDTGKTKILDKLRRTNVQDGEAGGITQQIGATNVPIAVIQEQCKMVQGFLDAPLRLPGLLIIDTPGHESFSNLRDRGSSLCDIAILVVDIMHGLEPQTIESLNLLKKKKTPFVVALNKIDRLYEWKPNRHKDVREVIASQPDNTRLEFLKRKNEVILGLAEQGLNAALFYENPDPEDYISLVPTSAHSGDGMGNLMASLVDMSQSFLAKRLSYTEELQATVLEVKAIGGFGTTIDIVLVNGRLKFGQTIVLAGTDGPIVTTVKALLTPSKMQDLRVKNQYIEHKDIMAAQGVKIAARELEKTIAGLSMRVANNPDEVEVLREAAERDLSTALNAIKCKPLGVFVQASTLGSL